MMQVQNDMSTVVNSFILRRINTLNAHHLPRKVVQVVCYKLTANQQTIFKHLVNDKDMQYVLDRKTQKCQECVKNLCEINMFFFNPNLFHLSYIIYIFILFLFHPHDNCHRRYNLKLAKNVLSCIFILQAHGTLVILKDCSVFYF